MQRQVPPTYLLIGNGRLARHLAHYFTAKNLTYTQWNRRDKDLSALQDLSQQADYILLLIRDDQIDPFIQKHPFLTKKPLIHCSGSLNSAYSLACHPLMTFGDALYSDSFYSDIPFVCDEAVDFDQVFPQLDNPHYQLPQSKKPGYHAMAVMAANFPQFIWQSLFREWQENLQLPHDLLQPLIQQSLINSVKTPENAPTGPFVRGDRQTIDRHKQALKNTPLADLYDCFDHWLKQKDSGVTYEY